MYETLIHLYTMAMINDVRSPTPHLFGPPGSGKSTVVQQLADAVGKTLHTINVSRISPLELEGVQMPVDNNTRLELLTATYWNRLEEGDILLFDEFLRGFPEVYNGLLDIFTSRTVNGFVLPRVFVIAASNSVVAYDKALEDRLLHLPVPDPRKKKAERKHLAKLLVEQVGLLPEMAESMEMQSLLDTEVLPTYELLDMLDRKSTNVAAASIKGRSLRNLIGQAQLRYVVSPSLSELIEINNHRAISASKYQYIVLLKGTNVAPAVVKAIMAMRGNPRLTEVQDRNTELNAQLIELAVARQEKEEDEDDDIF